MRTRSQQRGASASARGRVSELDKKTGKKKKEKKKIAGKKEPLARETVRLAAVRERYKAAALKGSYGGIEALARVLGSDAARGNTRSAKKTAAKEALRAESWSEGFTINGKRIWWMSRLFPARTRASSIYSA